MIRVTVPLGSFYCGKLVLNVQYCIPDLCILQCQISNTTLCLL